MKKKVGITGQPGFIGGHLFHYLRHKKDEYEMVPFEDRFFDDEGLLDSFTGQCDVIVHLAAMNRHPDQRVIYDTNIRLVRQLIQSLERTRRSPQVLFSSSTQEERDNPYGKSKFEGRKLLHDWSLRQQAKFTGLVIPNVFGPFCRPFYNSVIATFCHQLTHGQQPAIDVDASIRYIYINDLVEEIHRHISDNSSLPLHQVQESGQYRVSDILRILTHFKSEYMESGIIPVLNNRFELALFNTFRTYIDPEHYPVRFKVNTDDRGYLFENLKTYTMGQAFFSLTKPGITRGNHFHRRKIERFCVVRGQAVIRLRQIGTDRIIEYQVSGEEAAAVDMPVFHTHNITNTGPDDLLTLFWTNEFFNPDNSDTFFEEV
jgi:UDP-2-acetamido-2,6-beta-L-arabino-hexul-4-ose reductase